jgi:monoterpene epsilon-lactone hydrolase
MQISNRFVLAYSVFVLAGMGSSALAQETPFPLMPNVAMEPNGTLHFKDRTIPMPTLMSDEAKARYVQIITRFFSLKPGSREEMMQLMRQSAGAGAGMARGRDEVLKIYPSDAQDTEMGGVKVSIFTPKDIPARNKNRVVMMFNSVPTGIALASVGKMKVITVQYMPTQPQGTNQIIAVYKELLKIHKPSQIAMVGLSGGCQFAANTAVWLPAAKLPFPGALGLLTCAGGAAPGDTRVTMNGLDAQLSDYSFQGATRTSRTERPKSQPGEPPREILDVTTFPKGWPPSYLLSGTRDMCLSETVILHRRLKNAGVTTELNIWEGMWHGFTIDPELPETREAVADVAKFLDRYLRT